jgi:TRAP-type uncharacterized transport system substrate-binding protein
MKYVLAAFFALFATAVFADTLVIATGKEGGRYDERAHVIAQHLTQRGSVVSVENFNGSDEISLAVCGGRASIGIAQRDALFTRFTEGCDLKPIGLFGTEYAMILFPPKSPIGNLYDLTDKDTVQVDTIGSGSELFWKTITRIEKSDEGSKDAWANAQINNDPLSLAPVNAANGDIKAVVMVRQTNNPDVTRLLSLGWKLGYLYDKNIDDQKYKDGSLYVSSKIAVRYDGSTAKNWGYEIPSFIVVSKSLAANKALFSDVVAAAQ